jgi:hypothetical protein
MIQIVEYSLIFTIALISSLIIAFAVSILSISYYLSHRCELISNSSNTSYWYECNTTKRSQ